MFNIDQFVSGTVDPNATVFETVPEGDYRMMIDSDPAQISFTEDQKAQVGLKNPKGVSEKTGQPYDFWTLELRCIVQDEALKQKLGREQVTLRARINLDFTPDGQLETGPNKNVTLGQLREALGQNTPGWNPKRLLGAGPFIGRVVHTGKGDQKYPEVKRFAKIS